MRFKFLIVFLLSFTGRMSAHCQQPFFQESVVWEKGADSGIYEHFVYGLAEANDGTILAFAEGRLKRGDDSPHHITLKRSSDKGVSWLPTQIIVESREGECYANPAPVVDRKTGRIFLFYARNHENESSDVYFITSSDHGKTWTDPRGITALFDSDPLKRPFHLPGPGHGIQLKDGRLIVQVWHRYSIKLPVTDRRYGVSVIYSSDGGKTWHSGGYVPAPEAFPANESRLVELTDGRVLLDSRFAVTGLHLRIQSFSADKGLTWSAPVSGKQPPFTAVDAGMTSLRIKDRNYLVFTRPIDSAARKDLAVSISTDNGQTWGPSKMIYKGPANYSDIIALSDGTLFVLYGRGTPRYAAAARFNVEWITKETRGSSR